MTEDEGECSREGQSAQREDDSRYPDESGVSLERGYAQEQYAAQEQRVGPSFKHRRGELDQRRHPLASGARAVHAVPDEEGHDLEHQAEDGERDPPTESDNGIYERGTRSGDEVRGERQAEGSGRWDEGCSSEREAQTPVESRPPAAVRHLDHPESVSEQRRARRHRPAGNQGADAEESRHDRGHADAEAPQL